MPPTRLRPRRLGPVLLRAGVVLSCAAALSACEFPNVSMSPSVADSSSAARTTAPSSSAEPTAAEPAAETDEVVADAVPVAPVRPAGELDVGSVTHVVAAGDRQLVVDWWTSEQPTAWTAADDKTLQLSAHLEGGDPDADLEVLVTRFAAVLDDGAARTQVDEDSGEFAIQAPYTYGTVLSLPPSVAGATSVTVAIQFDLLIETEPGSQRYFRQTVMDSLVLPLTVPVATPSAAAQPTAATATATATAQENP